MTDSELLDLFIQSRSEDAFRALLERHLALVYAAALRQVRDPGTAQDIAQAVFVILARKSAEVGKKSTPLPAWLLVVTRYAAVNELRRRNARLRHEREAVVVKTPSASTIDSEVLSSIIDEAMNRLSGPDRTAIVVYYLENQSLRDVGAALAVSEAAAHKRISRALLRLRTILTRRGVTCPADALEASLRHFNAVAVSPILLAAALNSALHPSSATSNGLTRAVQDILRSLQMKKVRAFALSTLAVAVFAVPAVPLIDHSFSRGPSPKAPAFTTAPINLSSDTAAADFPDNIHAAWTNAGAVSGWMTPQGSWISPPGAIRPGDVPAFRFNQWTPGEISRLPSPDQSFGLDLENSNITDADLKELTGLRQLCELSLLKTKVTDAGLKELAGLTQLLYLNLGQTAMTDAGVKELTGLTQLIFLNLSNTQVTDASLSQLTSFTQLQSLGIIGTQVTDAGLKELAGLTQLQYLLLNSTQVTDAGLKELTGLTQLQELGLGDTQVTDAGLKELADMSQLHWLNLGGTHITDAGLQELAGFSQLHTLWLFNTSVTDAGLKVLAQFDQLRAVNLSGTRVTDAGVADLKQALPDLQIQR